MGRRVTCQQNLRPISLLFISSGVCCKTVAFALFKKTPPSWRHAATCVVLFFFPPAFLLPEPHWLSCSAARCHSPQTRQSVCLTWGKGERHSARCHQEGQPHATADPAPEYVQGCSSAIGKIRYTLFAPPGLYSYWHAFCVLVYALGTDSLFLQYSAETEWRITFCLCSQPHKGNTMKNTSDFSC